MAKQFLLNRGFENELDGYITLGSVSSYNDIAYSGMKSAKLLATPNSDAEISQVVFFIPPFSPVKFSFFVKRIYSEDVKEASNIRAEVNFTGPSGTVIPLGIVITVRGSDISKNVWSCYSGYTEVPYGALAAQVLIRLEPPESGSSGLLIDDLALEVAMPEPPPQTQAPPALQGFPAFPGLPFAPPPQAPAQPVQPGFPPFPGLFNPLFPASPSANLKPNAPGAPKQKG